MNMSRNKIIPNKILDSEYLKESLEPRKFVDPALNQKKENQLIEEGALELEESSTVKKKITREEMLKSRSESLNPPSDSEKDEK